ncbi:MAG: isocitrate lyase/PEP mutase family protein, partial [Chromatiales bacterium]|nr:isocitrate lyase/PEP mutase family protein [Chromatiales bacterium]
AGSTASLTVLGAPDIIVLTLTEFAAQCRRICRASNLPIIVDADHGYGNAMNVKRTVEEIDNAGIAALTIEDTVLPQSYGSTGAELIPIEEGVGKMKAALAGRDDPGLVIAGRTSATMIASVDEAIARVKAYEATGVDMLMLVGVKTRAELEAIAAEVSLPIMLGGLTPELNDKAYLAEQGVRIALQGHQPIMAAVQAIHDTLRALRDGVQPKDLVGVASAELMQKATHGTDYKRWQKDFLDIN